ncbi:DUF3347 domain-containing protein [Pelagicoccus mobilis]|uniref:DUF3347 domain-containing protein n=1 Tax=Pelagicoccus mobilis TaxID=415221 RepID=A0A934RWK7_9BACT|nr:DUF3347 domain-containing protein [Pelagicoccus mobilis]MBK1878132.1 DUF3347 domain-containing protein [Pelagicoccus mobilis]
MKKLILSLIAAFAAVSTLHAHCGTCAMDEMKGEHAGCSSCAQEQLSTYFSTQEGLAGDDLSAAKKGAKAFLAHAETLACTEGEDSCCATELNAAKAIAGSSDIAIARKAFKDWSDALLAKVDKAGLSDGVAYKMHCPMAFNNTGGTWLQAKSSLRNPYYGSMMLTCGMQTGSYAAGESGSDCCGSGGECCSDGKACCDDGSCESCKEKGHSHGHGDHSH